MQTASITADNSLELIGTCSGDCCDVEEGQAVSGGAGVVGGGTGGGEFGTEVLSTSTFGTGCSGLGGSSVTSSAASCCYCRIMDSGIYRDRSMDKTLG